MMDTILVVCIGNICRSPMAEALLKRTLPGKTILSAGLYALIGSPADPNSIAVMDEHGFDIRSHRARQLTSVLVNSADLILTMDMEQKHIIETNYSTAKGKVRRLGESGKFNIDDPFQKGIGSFHASFALIERGINDLKSQLLAIGQYHLYS